jgi:small-conductance mechanosensitive channel
MIMAPRMLAALAVLIAAWIVGKIAARLLKAVLARSNLRYTHKNFFGRLLVWLFLLIGLSIALTLVGLGGAAKGLLAGGGVTAVVLGFAFREIVENFLAGFFLAFNPPFNLGDLIESGNLQGTVRNVALRSTHIRTVDGRDIFIPSSQIFKNPLINYTKDGLRRQEFTIGIDYANDADVACRLLRDTVAQSGLALEKPAPFVGITNFTSNFVELTVHFWIDTFNPVPGVQSQRASMMALCRRTVIDAGYTISADISQNVALVDNRKDVSSNS